MKRLKNYLSLLFLTTPVLLYSQSKSGGIVPAGMQSLTDNIREVLMGPLVRSIMVIMLIGVAIAYGFNKDNDQLKRKLLAVGIAIAIIVGAITIVDSIWSASGG